MSVVRVLLQEQKDPHLVTRFCGWLDAASLEAENRGLRDAASRSATVAAGNSRSLPLSSGGPVAYVRWGAQLPEYNAKNEPTGRTYMRLITLKLPKARRDPGAQHIRIVFVPVHDPVSVSSLFRPSHAEEIAVLINQSLWEPANCALRPARQHVVVLPHCFPGVGVLEVAIAAGMTSDTGRSILQFMIGRRLNFNLAGPNVSIITHPPVLLHFLPSDR